MGHMRQNKANVNINGLSYFEYKCIWWDRNTSFSKMHGRYDRAHCSDNFNHKKVIIHRYEFSFEYKNTYEGEKT